MKISQKIDALLYNCRPTACSLFMSSSCNFRCPHCSRSIIGSSAAKDMTVKVVRRALDVYPELSSFTLAGFGEPTLCQEFVEIVRFLTENRNPPHVITNASNPAPLLACHNVDMSITISLYGYDPSSYQINTGTNSFVDVIENYKKLSSVFARVGFSLVLGRNNWRDLGRYVELFDRINPAFVVLVNHLAYDLNDDESISNILNEDDKFTMNDTMREFINRPYFITQPVFINSRQPALKCRSYNYIINIDGDGAIGGCQRQIGPGKRFGDLMSSNDPFNSIEMIRLRKRCGRELIHDECRYCFGNWVVMDFLADLSRSKFGIFGKLKRKLS